MRISYTLSTLAVTAAQTSGATSSFESLQNSVNANREMLDLINVQLQEDMGYGSMAQTVDANSLSQFINRTDEQVTNVVATLNSQLAPLTPSLSEAIGNALLEPILLSVTQGARLFVTRLINNPDFGTQNAQLVQYLTGNYTSFVNLAGNDGLDTSQLDSLSFEISSALAREEVSGNSTRIDAASNAGIQKRQELVSSLYNREFQIDDLNSKVGLNDATALLDYNTPPATSDSRYHPDVPNPTTTTSPGQAFDWYVTDDGPNQLGSQTSVVTPDSQLSAPTPTTIISQKPPFDWYLTDDYPSQVLSKTSSATPNNDDGQWTPWVTDAGSSQPGQMTDATSGTEQPWSTATDVYSQSDSTFSSSQKEEPTDVYSQSTSYTSSTQEEGPTDVYSQPNSTTSSIQEEESSTSASPSWSLQTSEPSVSSNSSDLKNGQWTPWVPASSLDQQSANQTTHASQRSDLAAQPSPTEVTSSDENVESLRSAFLAVQNNIAQLNRLISQQSCQSNTNCVQNYLYYANQQVSWADQAMNTFLALQSRDIPDSIGKYLLNPLIGAVSRGTEHLATNVDMLARQPTGTSLPQLQDYVQTLKNFGNTAVKSGASESAVAALRSATFNLNSVNLSPS